MQILLRLLICTLSHIYRDSAVVAVHKFSECGLTARPELLRHSGCEPVEADEI